MLSCTLTPALALIDPPPPAQAKDPDAKPYPRMLAPVSGGGAMPVSAAMGMKRGKSQVRCCVAFACHCLLGQGGRTRGSLRCFIEHCCCIL